MIALYILLSILGLLIVALLIFYAYFFKYTFYRKQVDSLTSFINKINYKEGAVKMIEDGIKWFDTICGKEDVYTKSFDGLNLHAIYVPANQEKIIILFHGYHSIAKNDFSYNMVEYHNMGLDILLVDQRAHGKSEGNLITYGVKERYDVISWVEFVKKNYPNRKIYIGGLSMGASTVMMASNLVDDDVVAIISDCGFTSPKDIITHVAKSRFNMPSVFVMPLGLLAKIIGKFDYRVSSKDALAKTKAPILFIHGKEDDFVPTYMTEQNFNSCNSKKSVVYVDKAQHANSFLIGKDKVLPAIKELIEQSDMQM